MELTPTRKGLGAVALALALTAAPALAQTDGEGGQGEAPPATPPASQPETPEAKAEENAKAESVPAPDPEASAFDTVATVNGEELRLGALAILKRELPQQYQQLPDEILAQGLTQQLVDQALMAEAAREAGIDEEPATAFALEARRRGVLAEAYMRREIGERLTEERLREAYEAQYADAEPAREIRASHILVESEEQAQEIRGRLDEGEDFAALAQEFGTDGTASRGGDLGFFAREDMVPEFAEAAFALDVGETGGPVESPFGWHLIRVVDSRERPVPPFEEVAPEIAQTLQQQIQRDIVDELRAEATIETPEGAVPPGALSDPALFEAPSSEGDDAGGDADEAGSTPGEGD
ncbi:MAG: peptidylprolyl isomerase [Paracoccaceae bacterium]